MNQPIEMSLHRIIAEIKAAEAALSSIHGTVYVYTAPVDNATETAEGKRLSQIAFDKTVSQLNKLAKLKAARNLANATTKVKIAGVEMTIDEALALKAANSYKTSLVNVLRQQMVNGQTRVQSVQSAIEQKIATQVQAASSGTKKATDEEIKVFRQLAERNTKLDIAVVDGLKERIEQMTAELEAFNTEVDYALSEVNATTKVQVAL
jgi:hypothetical protein